MKKLLLIAIALITVNATAQEQKREGQRKGRMEKAQYFKDFSPEEMATLQTKKLALDLDLTETQQQKIQAIHLEQAKARKTEMEARKKTRTEGKKEIATKDDRFKRANSQLDKKLAMKAKMKDILSKEQFEKWEINNTRKERQGNKMRNKEPRKRKQRQ